MNKQEKIKQLMEATLLEVRLPTGYFLVTTTFQLPSADKEWETVFNQGETIKLDPSSKSIQTLNKSDGRWVDKDISLLDLMQPQQYRIFQQGVRKMNPDEVQALTGRSSAPVTPELEFTTTVRGMAKRIRDYKLDPGTKIKITVIK